MTCRKTSAAEAALKRGAVANISAPDEFGALFIADTPRRTAIRRHGDDADVSHKIEQAAPVLLAR